MPSNGEQAPKILGEPRETMLTRLVWGRLMGGASLLCGRRYQSVLGTTAEVSLRLLILNMGRRP